MRPRRRNAGGGRPVSLPIPAAESATEQRQPSSEILTGTQRLLVRLLLGGFVLLLGGGLFLLASDGASPAATWALFLHIAGGALLLPVLLLFALPHAFTQMRRRPVIGLTGAVMLFAALAVAYTGALLTLERAAARPSWTAWVHAAVGAGLVALYAVHRRFGTNPASWRRLTAGVVAVLVVGLGFASWERAAPAPLLAVAAVNDAEQPFLPSLVQTAGGGYLADSSTLTDISSCESCHPRIAEDWRRSAHRHASFTNPFYKGTIKAMRAKSPLENTRWCAGCHDPALLFTGKMDRPDLDLERDPDALVGLTCIACHAIEPLSILGNGHYTLSERRVYAWEKSDDPAVVKAHDVLLKAKPDAHLESLRPPNIQDPAFCAACHKAEIPPEVNDWKWLRVQDEYDGWHDSGVSLNNIRSFYHPARARRCQECHMPLVADPEDPAADADGLVRSHLFAAANSALPFLRGDEDMIERSRLMLRSSARLDMTAVVLEPEPGREERRLFAPAWRILPAVRPGEIVEVQVVVRNHGVGHPFPGGTIDSNEVWVAFEARVGDDEPFYVSGAVDPVTRHVDPTAEFYRSFLMDREGNRVVNRLGPDIYTRVYAKVIGPGTADVVRYRFRVPKDAAGVLRLSATLRYRKFMQAYIDFLFPESKVIEHRLDDGTFRSVDLNALPIQDLGEAALDLAITEEGTVGPAPDPAEAAEPSDFLRVNDLGIAYLLQSDSYGAERLFEAVTRIDPNYADGWVNIARARIANADWGGAFQALAQAREVEPGFLKARFFEGQIHSRLAQWRLAERAYREVLEDWPKERQALRSLTEALYEQDRYEEALEVIERLFAIDPEDARGWFWAYRSLTQLGDEDRARAAGEAFDRFRQDDSEPQRAGALQLEDPILQRLAQPIHVHLGPGVDTRSGD